MDPEKKWKEKKIPKVTVMAVVVDSVYGTYAQVIVQRASDFGVFSFISTMTGFALKYAPQHRCMRLHGQ